MSRELQERPVVAAVNPSISVEDSYALCREIAKREAKNFYYAFVALPKAKRDAMCAIYAFMRHADDLSDDESRTILQRRTDMAQWVMDWHRAQQGEASRDPLFPAVLDAKERFRIPSPLLEQLISGTAMDLETPIRPAGYYDTYQSFDELYQYCYLVASVVGLVCIRIFGYQDVRAEKLAEQTGIAFQLTNILRDVREDAERGRIYLPIDQLTRYDVTVEQLAMLVRGAKMQAHQRAALAEIAQQAEDFYASAQDLLKLIDADSRPALRVLVTIYHRLLLRIQAKDYDVFQERVSVPTHEKVLLLVQGVLGVLWYRVAFWERWRWLAG